MSSKFLSNQPRENALRQVVVQQVCSEGDNEEMVTRLTAILSGALSRRLARLQTGTDGSNPSLD